MYELTKYLTRHHPNMYSVTRHPLPRHEHGNAWYGEGRITTITIIPWKTSTTWTPKNH